MDHPHGYLLSEFRIAIDKLVPLAPRELHDEAEKIYAELAGDMAATERQISQAMAHIGRKEYPYRKAYQEICAGDEEQRLQKAALNLLEGDIKEKVEKVTAHGVSIHDYANSKLFERDLAPEERYRVEQAILQAHDAVNRQCDERAKERQTNFEALVQRWREHETKVQTLINHLRELADRAPEYASEIRAKADELEEGWSVVERDPTEEAVRAEIAHYAEVIAQAEDSMEASEEIF